MRDVWITGIGIISCLGYGKEQHLEKLKQNRTGLGEHVFFDNRRPDPCISGVIPYEHIPYSLKESAHFRADIVLDKAASSAMKDAGLSRGCECDIITGSTLNNIYGAVLYYEHLRNNEPAELGLLKNFLHSSTPEMLKKKYGFKGSVKAVGSACGSGSAAIGSAYNRIRNGLSGRAVAGGYEALSPYVAAGFNSLMLLSKDVCRPFDKERDGLNPGEGAAVFILESEDAARERGVREPDFKICGYGGALDSYHNTHAHPEGRGLVSSIESALQESGIGAEDIDCIHMHGTATVVNDRSEYSACRKVFGEGLGRVPALSTKSFTGHTFAASGAISTALSCISASEGFIPKTLNCETVDPEFRELNITKEIIREKKVRYILVTSLGFGGESFSLVVKNIKV